MDRTRPPANGPGRNDLLSVHQRRLIDRLAIKAGLSLTDLIALCETRYRRHPDDLSAYEASRIIKTLARRIEG